MTRLWVVIAFILASVGSTISQPGPSDEFKQAVAAVQHDPSDRTSREKAIRLALAMQPSPAISDDARRAMIRGEAAFKGATGPADYQEAVTDLQNASNLAPWVGSIYFNLALAQDKSGHLAAAVNSLDLYLLTQPPEKDAANAKDLKYEIEFRKDKQEKEAAQRVAAGQAAREEQQAAARARASNPVGHWYYILNGNFIDYLTITAAPAGGFFVSLSQPGSSAVENLSFDGRTLRWSENWYTATRISEFTISADGNSMQGLAEAWQAPTPTQIKWQEDINKKRGRNVHFDYSNVGKGSQMTLYRR